MIIIAIPKPTTEYDRFLLKHFLGVFLYSFFVITKSFGFFLIKSLVKFCSFTFK